VERGLDSAYIQEHIEWKRILAKLADIGAVWLVSFLFPSELFWYVLQTQQICAILLSYASAENLEGVLYLRI
jgi:hypothetical protein